MNNLINQADIAARHGYKERSVRVILAMYKPKRIYIRVGESRHRKSFYDISEIDDVMSKYKSRPRPVKAPKQKLINKRQIAEKYGYSVKYIAKITSQDPAFPEIKLKTQSCFYDAKEVDKYMDARKKKTELSRLANAEGMRKKLPWYKEPCKNDDIETHYKSTKFNEVDMLMRGFICERR